MLYAVGSAGILKQREKQEENALRKKGGICMRNKSLLYVIMMMVVCLVACGNGTAKNEQETLETETLEEESEEVSEGSSDALEVESKEESENPDALEAESKEEQEESDAFAAESEEDQKQPDPPQVSNSEEELFMQFLNNEVEAVIGDTFQDDLYYACKIHDYSPDGEDTYTFGEKENITLEELNAAVDASDSLFLNPLEVERYYAFLSTVDGGEIFAVKYQNLGIYCEGDNSYAAFFFAVNDGVLYLTYAYDDWARRYTTITEPLAFVGGGSSGAGDHHGWSGYIDKRGQYREIFSAEYLSDEWISMEAWYRYDIDLLSGYEGCTFELLEMQDGKNYYYYFYEDGADVAEDEETFAAFCNCLEEDGMIRIETNEEMNKLIDTAYEEIGFTEALMPFESWTALD